MIKMTKRTIAAIAVTLALGVAAGLVILAAQGGGASRSASGHGTSHQAAGGPTASPAPTAPAAPKSAPLQLIAGTGWVNGIYTRYPRTQAGAVSAAVEFMTELGSTLDPDRAATVARLTADTSYHGAAQDAAASAIAARRALGLPVAGSLPAGTGAFLVPVMYQLHGISADQLTVFLLYNYTLTQRSGVAEHVGVGAVSLIWTPAGWRLLTPPADDLAKLLATPGTADSAAKGWKAMTNNGL
jgi:hypothetical protein